MMNIISLEELLVFHDKIIEKTGGAEGIRDLNLIESALKGAFVTFDGEDLYKEPVDKIVAITYGLIKNHGFIDGNKRMGIAVMLLLLQINDLRIKYSQKELIELELGIVGGSVMGEELKGWAKNHRLG
ncbi:MAG: type II toxin-antitoxin system death-on-curing family toxin [Clostridia bacterium]|nr:type II toxin-antitoxin system death-on-curing family toxin [Clostridia bacterium]